MLDRRGEIVKTLRATPVMVRALVDGVDDARLRRRPAPGEWAIIEVVAHLADTEERALGRVRRMLAEDTPQLEPFDQEALAVQRHYWTWTWRVSWPAGSSSAQSTWPCSTASMGRVGSALASMASTA
jgi:DinB superfamily